MLENSLWVERYRSSNLEEYVGNDQIKKVVSKYLQTNDLQNLCLYGQAGGGKTTLAKMIVNNIDCDYLYINASDERGIETIREKVTGFASVMSFKPIKVIILDEADYLTIQAQASLRNVIETFSQQTRFILTCNYIERIIDPIQSRCQVLKIQPPSKKDIAVHLKSILEKENVKFDVKDLGTAVNTFYPDLRKMINTLQSNTTDGVLSLEGTSLLDANYLKKVLHILQNPTKTSFRDIRQVLADSNIEDYGDIFKFLYNNLDKFAVGHEGEVTILIEEYQYHSNFRVDGEINFMALISQILKLITNKLILS